MSTGESFGGPDLEQLVRQARGRVELYRMVGEMAVKYLRRRIDQTLSSSSASAPAQQSPVVPPVPAAKQGPTVKRSPPAKKAAPAKKAPSAKKAPPAARKVAPRRRRTPLERAPAPAPEGDDHLAVPEYDALSATQVLPRLSGLSARELEALRAYEAAHRGRQTILNRVAQIQAQ